MANDNGHVVRLMSTENAERTEQDRQQQEQQSPMLPQRIVWWFAGFLVVQSAILFLHSSTTRHELNENAKLIEQLQKRIIINDLSILRKGTP